MKDPNALFYLVDIYIYTDKLREALTMLAKTLIKYPLMVHLLFKQAQCLLKFKHFEYALKVSKVCVDLCPTSYEAWTLHAECLIELQKMKKALIAIDLMPCADDTPYISLPEPEPTYDL